MHEDRVAVFYGVEAQLPQVVVKFKALSSLQWVGAIAIAYLKQSLQVYNNL